MLFMDGKANGIQYRRLAIDEILVQMLNCRNQLGIGHSLIVLISPASLQKIAGAGTVNIYLSSGPTANGTNPGIFGGTEPFGRALGTQRTARHGPRSIAQRLTLQ